MRVPQHIVALYYKSVRRYKKLVLRIRKEENNGGFKYHSLLYQLKKLRKKLADLHFQLKIATASGVLLLGLGLSSAQAQTQTNNGPFSLQTRSNNPLREPFKFDGTTYPSKVDLDKDGDYDLVVGHEGEFNYNYNPQYGYIQPLRYLVNVGTNTTPRYEEKKGSENPFNGLVILNRERAPVFADIDKDGDEDLFVGTSHYSTGRILYFKNDADVFTEQTTAWDPVSKTGNPFHDIEIYNNLKVSFVDLDKDGDLDALIAGTSYDPYSGSGKFINYYKNDGTGVFTEANSEITMSPAPDRNDLNPSVADVDGDGDVDLVFGGYYLGLRFYRQTSPGNFVEGIGPWDPGTLTGNPFDDIYEPNTQPLFVDIDNDSDPDLLLGDGDGDHSFNYPNNIIHLFENKGNGVFEEQPDLANPLGGIDVGFNASPVLVDLDGDEDLDALIGNKYAQYSYGYNAPAYYNQDEGILKLKEGEEDPFDQLEVYGHFTPAIVDLDGDSDLDVISGDYYGGVHFFRNDDGEYTEEIEFSPFSGIDIGSITSPELVDLDGDQDLDLVLSNSAEIRYYANTGTPQSPVYEEKVDSENPFRDVGIFNSYGFLNLTDIDHDGDLDLLTSEYFYFKYYGSNKIFYYENTGTPHTPAFVIADTQPFFGITIVNDYNDSRYLQPFMADHDKDGDLDVFIGDDFGYISYVKNDNPAVTASIAGSEIIYRVGTDDEVIIDANITLTDEDDDLIVQATVTISNFDPGDELIFTPHAGIAGAFNNANGVLTFKGKATLAEYEVLLRTVAYHYSVDGGRTRPSKKSVLSKTVEFRIFDTDFTNPVPATRGVQVINNTPPVLADAAKTTQVGTTVTIALNQLISDPDDNVDISSLRIVQQPSSGAFAEIDANQNLVIDYTGVNFTGTDNLVMEVCDDLGDCAQNLITITVENSSGEIAIYNAVAPNSSGDNRFMRIHYLPANNNVSVYNRWGDKVFEIDNYDSEVPGKRFEGVNESGKPLPSGTYFYTIEIPGKSKITGYLTLKQ